MLTAGDGWREHVPEPLASSVWAAWAASKADRVRSCTGSPQPGARSRWPASRWQQKSPARSAPGRL